MKKFPVVLFILGVSLLSAQADPVEFRYNKKDATRVYVVGDFNSWKISSHYRLKKTKKGFYKKVDLPVGFYNYAFSVRRKRGKRKEIVADRENPVHYTNSNGQELSILHVAYGGGLIFSPAKMNEPFNRLEALFSYLLVKNDLKRLERIFSPGNPMVMDAKVLMKKIKKVPYSFTYRSTSAEKVAILGDFNDWNQEPLTPLNSREGIWEYTPELEPGVYAYIYQVTGRDPSKKPVHVTDPENPNLFKNIYDGIQVSLAVSPPSFSPAEAEARINNLLASAINAGHYYKISGNPTLSKWWFQKTNNVLKKMDFLYYNIMKKTFIGHAPPAFNLDDLDGVKQSPSRYPGKVLLIDFWATWCAPCRYAMPHIRRIYEKYHADGLEIIGISLDTDTSLLKKFLKESDISWPQVIQPKKFKSPVPTAYYINAIPSSILVGKDGTVRAVDVSTTDLEKKIIEMLKE